VQRRLFIEMLNDQNILISSTSESILEDVMSLVL
jgi:hypothetical protein